MMRYLKEDTIKKLIPVLSKKEKQEIIAYHTVYEKYEKELSQRATEDLKDHPVFGKLIRDIPKEISEERNRRSRALQKDAIMNDNWQPYIEYQIGQGIMYAKMGLDFKSWYEVIALVRNYMTPFLHREYGSSAELLSVLNGMNCFMDIAMGIIGEAYLEERNEIINQDKEEIIKVYKEKETVLNRISDGVVSVDNDWRYTFLNDVSLATHPLGREETLGRVIWDIHPEMKGTVFWDKYHEAMQTKKVVEIESHYAPMNTWFSVKVYPSSDGLTIFYKDVTESKKAEEKLKKSNELFSNLFERNPASIIISRLDNAEITNVNEAFLSLFKFPTKQEVIGKTSAGLNILSHPKQREEIRQLLIKDQVVKDFETTVRSTQGDLISVSVSLALVEVNNMPCMFSILIDISDRKKAEEQIKQLNEELEQKVLERTAELESSNKELESFSYSVSHDLRSPIRAISGYAKILEEDYAEKFDAEGTKVLYSIRHNSKKMGELIDDLLAFSKLGRKQLSVSDMDMTDLVKSAKEELLTEDSENSTEFNVKALPPAKGDQSLIKQVWLNLISNAIKYSKNTAKTKIDIGAYEKDNFFVYFVKDNGVGFDMQYYDNLFGVFQRLHSQEEFEGTGVGLAIVQKIVQRHNGTVWAESKLNDGACFYFSLPNINS